MNVENIIFLNELNFDITFPRALPAESARVVAHSVKFRFSSKIIPRYLYFVTNSKNLSPYLNLHFVGCFLGFLKCII